MQVFPKPVSFDWDKGNIEKNWQKHRVRVQEAEEIFDSVPNAVFPDKGHSGTEKRYGIWGVSQGGRALTCIFTMRGNKVRVISARGMSKRERKYFEKFIKGVEKGD